MTRIATLLLISLATIGFSAGAKDTVTQPVSGITCHIETRRDPPMRVFIAEIDLTNPRVHLRVARGGPDPDGPGKWQTTLMQPTKIADREHFDLVVNGDFFAARDIKDAEGAKSKYRSDAWALVTGPAVTDGKVWSTGLTNRPGWYSARTKK